MNTIVKSCETCAMMSPSAVCDCFMRDFSEWVPKPDCFMPKEKSCSNCRFESDGGRDCSSCKGLSLWIGNYSIMDANNNILEKCVKYYADEKNWEDIEIAGEVEHKTRLMTDWVKGYVIARQALGEIK